jgi:hypothetical protein
MHEILDFDRGYLLAILQFNRPGAATKVLECYICVTTRRMNAANLSPDWIIYRICRAER